MAVVVAVVVMDVVLLVEHAPIYFHICARHIDTGCGQSFGGRRGVATGFEELGKGYALRRVKGCTMTLALLPGHQ